ncbi:MAG: DUF4332 domain-containing protein [Gammaproteobacteria bacterium]
MVYFAAYFGLFFAIGGLLGFALGYVYRGTKQPAVVRPQAVVKPVAVASAQISGLPGMTPAAASSLAATGIDSLAALRAATDSDDKLVALADALRLEDFALRKWVNVAQLQSVAGVDGDLANALLRVGVRGAAALAGENPDRIQNKLAALHDAEGLPENVPDRQSVAAMIAAAAS